MHRCLTLKIYPQGRGKNPIRLYPEVGSYNFSDSLQATDGSNNLSSFPRSENSMTLDKTIATDTALKCTGNSSVIPKFEILCNANYAILSNGICKKYGTFTFEEVTVENDIRVYKGRFTEATKEFEQILSTSINDLCLEDFKFSATTVNQITRRDWPYEIGPYYKHNPYWASLKHMGGRFQQQTTNLQLFDIRDRFLDVHLSYIFQKFAEKGGFAWDSKLLRTEWFRRLLLPQVNDWCDAFDVVRADSIAERTTEELQPAFLWDVTTSTREVVVLNWDLERADETQIIRYDTSLSTFKPQVSGTYCFNIVDFHFETPSQTNLAFVNPPVARIEFRENADGTGAIFGQTSDFPFDPISSFGTIITIDEEVYAEIDAGQRVHAVLVWEIEAGSQGFIQVRNLFTNINPTAPPTISFILKENPLNRELKMAGLFPDLTLRDLIEKFPLYLVFKNVGRGVVRLDPLFDVTLPTGEKIKGIVMGRPWSTTLKDIDCDSLVDKIIIPEHKNRCYQHVQDTDDFYNVNEFLWKKTQLRFGDAEKTEIETFYATTQMEWTVKDDPTGFQGIRIPFITDSEPFVSLDLDPWFGAEPRLLYKVGIVEGNWVYDVDSVGGNLPIQVPDYPLATFWDKERGINLGWDDREGVDGMYKIGQYQKLDGLSDCGRKLTLRARVCNPCDLDILKPVFVRTELGSGNFIIEKMSYDFAGVEGWVNLELTRIGRV